MATQPLSQSYDPPVLFPVKPNIRVVFSAGDAAVAIRVVLEELPSSIRTATLDEVAIRASAEELIVRAKADLSGPMYRAFLRWGAAAAAFESDRDDELSDGLCAALMEALRDLSACPAHSFQDAMFKSWLLALEVSDSPSFGPLRFRPESPEYLLTSVGAGVGRDLPVMSPLVAHIERLSTRAASFSPPKCGFPFTREIGAMLIGAFISAAQSSVIDADQGTSWDAAMSAYLASDHLCLATSSDHPEADARVDACCEAMDYLIEKVRAPNIDALNLKLSLALERAECFEDVLFDDHARGIIADIKHLADEPVVADAHASLLEERNGALLAINDSTESQLSADLADVQCSIAAERENEIAETAATSKSGVIAKLALIAQTALEGSSPDPDWCASALLDARRVAGIGSLAAAAEPRHRDMAA